MPDSPAPPTPFSPPVSVLFVCLGNICRSPMAEGIFLDLLEGDPRFEVDSAGTGSWHVGERPDPRARAVAEENGIVLTSRGRQVTAEDLDRFHLVIAMDRANLEALEGLRTRTGSVGSELRLLRTFDPEADPHRDPRDLDVPDPYWDDDGFREVFAMLRRSLQTLLDHLEDRLP
jgi:protein-tyrosine phosphatase